MGTPCFTRLARNSNVPFIEMKMLKALTERSKYYSSLMSTDLARAYSTLAREKEGNGIDHLSAAIQWLCRAQDAYDDGGVARSYSIVYNRFFRRKGWIHSYPETTGYIIPTMFDYAGKTGERAIFDRAVRMADWECRIQMDNGAVQGGVINTPPTPAIFNTGQVIFGWIRAFQETADDKYLESATRAGNYLVATQDQDGAWRKNLSDYASRKMIFYTYNTRTAWALYALYSVTHEETYRKAAIRNIEFALGQQRANGWFPNNCLFNPTRPLLHTIAYSLRGILEIGIALQDDRYIVAAQKAADHLLETQKEDGSLSGQFNDHWEPTADYSCLTGDAQIGIIWGRLYEITAKASYLTGLITVNRFLKRVQLRGTGNPSLDGGVTGSYPLHGLYGRFEVLSWATKFFADALMLESSIVKEFTGTVR